MFVRMLPWASTMAGRIDRLWCESALLAGNPLGDPTTRPVWVQVPPGYDADDRRYPVLFWLTGFMGQVNRWDFRPPYGRPFPEIADELMASGTVAPTLIVYVDGWSSYGCSQYVDSPAQGSHHSHLCDEVVPFVDERYRTIAGRDHRGITGRSSGGFGATVAAMLRPDLFSVFGSHAGDSLYETNFIRLFPEAVRLLQPHGGDIMAFWEDFKIKDSPPTPGDQTLLIVLAVAAAYSSDDDGTIRLPFDPATGRLRPHIWQRWLDWDPVRMVERPDVAEAMRSMRGIWLDAGSQDDYFLDLGAQAFANGLRKSGVGDDVLHFELVTGDHFTIDQRSPDALRWLSQRLSGAAGEPGCRRNEPQ